VHGACYSSVAPVVPSAPRLVAVSREVAGLLGMDEAFLHSESFLRAFSGHPLLPGMQPFAMCYGGHQFGHWAGQLGDGRAINLGEVVGPGGDRWMMQLKGAGPTPYSRNADGFAVLRSSVREFLCSEAMHHLGVPTTRALSLITTGDRVVRDMFYDGRPQREPGAVVCRVAPSFVRFGSFELFAARDDLETLQRLIDYVIRTDFPELVGESRDDSTPLVTEVRSRWFREICCRTAVMIAHWMRVGFVHGVMNTDNMSILGLTIDYGPYGWLEDYDPSWTPNTTDNEGRRYAYGQQPQIAYWNLVQLANAVFPCLQDKDALEEGIQAYVATLQSEWQTMMVGKLGWRGWRTGDEAITESLFELLRCTETDMTWFYRLLGELPLDALDAASASPWMESVMQHMQPAFYRPETVDAKVISRYTDWFLTYANRVRDEPIRDAERRLTMHAHNPKFVLRNYLAQLAIDAVEQGDTSEISTLLDVLRSPYSDQPGLDRYAEKRPEWARERAGCSMLSCSS
jgi:serine/tyrosine/threonine adenylyltransferase